VTSQSRSKGRHVTFLTEAVNDLMLLNTARPAVARAVVSVLVRLERGVITPTRLRSFTKTGDLSDCGKLTVLVEDHPEHRIVVRDVGNGHFEVIEVVAIAERTDDVAYLISGLRLGRITDRIRKSDTEQRLARIVAGRKPKGR